MIRGTDMFDEGEKQDIRNFDIPSKGHITESADPIFGYTLKVVTQVQEDEDNFIFHHLQQYCEGVLSEVGFTRVSKRLLIRALTCFKEEHKDEFDILMEDKK